MKIGVSAFAWTARFEAAHFHVLSSLREHGISGFEIPMLNPETIDAPAIRNAMQQHDLECTVCGILPAGINPISPDEDVRRRSVDHVIRCIERTAEMGATLLCGPLYAPIGYLPNRRRSVEEWNWAQECFRRVGESLDANNVSVAIEPVSRSETMFLRTAADAQSFCEAVGHPRIGVTIDTFHANIEEKSIPGAAKSLGGRLKHLHLSENDRGMLGSGHIDFPALLRVLEREHYEGYLMIEGFGHSPDEPDSFGNLWGDVRVSPEDIAFGGAKYLRELLNHV